MPALKAQKPKTWAEELRDLEDPAPKDYDPEDGGVEELSTDGDGADEEGNGREHYEKLGKGLLRQSKKVDLGPRYTGVSVGRDSLESDEGTELSEGSIDDIAHDSDESSYEAVQPPSFKSRSIAVKTDRRITLPEVTDESSDNEGASLFDEEDEEMVSPNLIEDDTASVSDGTPPSSPSSPSSDRAAIRKMMAEEQTVVASGLAKAAQSDISKGHALKQQRQTFNSLLNTRIKLQKALVSTNSFSAYSQPSDASQLPPDHAKIVQAAETAALDLWNSLNSLRSTFDPPDSEVAKKRPYTATRSSSSDALWQEMDAHEHASHPKRRVVLTKWSQKTAPISTVSRANKFSQTPTQQPLTSVLDQQLSGSNLDRHIARTKVARSCAPMQAAAKPGEGGTEMEDSGGIGEVYDDADFYTLLLRELVDQRMGEQTSAIGDGSIGGVVIPNQRELKAKKAVDTKASKGRKMRYNVHEKLMNFMAPEDLNQWGERQRKELFSSLLGQKPVAYGSANGEVGEDMDIDSPGEAEAQGLRFFG